MARVNTLSQNASSRPVVRRRSGDASPSTTTGLLARAGRAARRARPYPANLRDGVRGHPPRRYNETGGARSVGRPSVTGGQIGRIVVGGEFGPLLARPSN